MSIEVLFEIIETILNWFTSQDSSPKYVLLTFKKTFGAFQAVARRITNHGSADEMLMN